MHKKNRAKHERRKAARARRRLVPKVLGIKTIGKSETGYSRRKEVLVRLGFSCYAEYLASDLWNSIRDRVSPPGTKCSLCGRDAKVVHHQDYGEAVMRGEDLKPLIPLCHAHHRKIEFDADGKKRTFWKVVRRLNQMLRRGAPEQRKRKAIRSCSTASCSNWAKKNSHFCRPCLLLKQGIRPQDVVTGLSRSIRRVMATLDTRSLETVEVTWELLEYGKTGPAGYKRSQAELLGVPWPLRSGWRHRVVGTFITEEAAAAFLALRTPDSGRMVGNRGPR